LINSPILIFRNPLLMPAILAWFVAQFIKLILTLVFSKKLDFHRLVGSGGMPSSHSAFVVALCVSAGIRHGWDSALFAVSMVLATIVMYDAAGVRRAAGRHAAVLNRIARSMTETGQTAERHEALRELLGHTPVEVIAGALLGTLIAVVYIMRF
jgi:acid phosphatase family membrane protein YuiD